MPIKNNRAALPELRTLINLAYRSKLSIAQIEERAQIGRTLIHQWKYGRYGANLKSVVSVGKVLGYRLEWVKDDETQH